MISFITNFLGGVGLLLLGMWLLTEGLRSAAGPNLRNNLHRWSGNNRQSLLRGFLLTAGVQSSSLISAATLGFVNAQLLSLERGIWIIYGSNVGTTLSAWIAALVGVRFNIDGFAFVWIGFGMLLRLWKSKAWAQGLGMAIAGLGCFFLALNTLKNGFSTPDINLVSLSFMRDSGFISMLIGFGAGVVFTVLMQSSTAVSILLLAAVSNQTVSLPFAAAGVIGANIGTTSTIVLASLGATANARRLAAVHVLFNVCSGIIALVLLSPFLWLTAQLASLVNGVTDAALSLALFNTLFNIFGVLIMWPMPRPIINWLQGRWQHLQHTDNYQRLEYLDQHSLVIPTVALKSFYLEIHRLGRDVLNAAHDVLKSAHPQQTKLQQLHQRIELIRHATNLLNQSPLSKDVSEKLPILLRALIHYQMLLEHLQTDLPSFNAQSIPAELNDIYQQINLYVAEIIRLGQQEITNQDLAKITVDWQSLLERYQLLKRKTLQITAEGNLSVASGDQLLRQLETLYIIADRTLRAGERLLATSDPINKAKP